MKRFLLICDRESCRGSALLAVSRLQGWEADHARTRTALEDLAASLRRDSLRQGCIVTWCGVAEVSSFVHQLRGPECQWEGSIITLVPNCGEETVGIRLGWRSGPLLTKIGAVTIRDAAISLLELLWCIKENAGLQFDRWLDMLAANDVVEPLRNELDALEVVREEAVMADHCEKIRNLLFQVNLDVLEHVEAGRIRKELTRVIDVGDRSALAAWIGTARDAVRQLERAWMR